MEATVDILTLPEVHGLDRSLQVAQLGHPMMRLTVNGTDGQPEHYVVVHNPTHVGIVDPNDDDEFLSLRADATVAEVITAYYSYATGIRRGEVRGRLSLQQELQTAWLAVRSLLDPVRVG